MNIATIGTSWITDSFIKSASYVKDVNISAVCSRSRDKAENFASDHGISVFYDDIDEMLNDDFIDGVYIASPNCCHFEQAMKCLKAGKHVICEKPATVTTYQLEELYKEADNRGLVFLEAMKSMHSDGLPLIRKAIENIGEIHTASLDFSQLSSKYPALLNGEHPNIFNPQLCTGGLMDIGVYAVYFAVELFGKPHKIMSSCDFLETGADYCGTLVFVYDKLTVTITYSKVANGFLGSRILGDMGAVTVKSLSKLIGINLVDNDGTTTEIYPEVNENIVMSKEIKAFSDFSQGKNMDYYDYCRHTAFDVCDVMEKIRKQNNFMF